MSLLLRNIDELHLADGEGRVIAGAHVAIEDGRIADISAVPIPEERFDEVIDLTGHIVTPGLVNTHHHFFQSLTRAIPAVQRGHLLDWLLKLYPLWAGMTPEHLAAATEAACAELLLSGTTATSDHLYLVPRADPAYAEAEIAAASALGIRLNLVRGSMTGMEADLGAQLDALLGERAGGVLDDEDAVLADMERLARRHHDASPDSKLTVAFGPTTVTYHNLDFMRRVAALAGDYACGLHTHFHPRPDERETCRGLDASPVDVLAEIGWLRPGTWIAHGTRLDAYDIGRLVENGVALAHCPRMILRLGARVPPLHDYIAAGMRVGIGVDGAASNDCGSMVNEIRIAALLHRVASGGGEVPPEGWLLPAEVLRLATADGAQVIGRPDLGQIRVGGPADIAAFDLRGVGYAGARTDLLSGFILAGSETRAAYTVVGGQIRVRGGELVDYDEQAIRERLDRATAQLIGQLSDKLGWDYRNFEGGRSDVVLG
ncbi:amidohydrolase family protein [Methyloligella sp. 2.7D]|uniref:amidohydrolase family protein n=1 Tax=unclassified Methyloligella TaxID=2625955 RepID=UPI00157DFE90|nr:amidohydrolase family protein [Methyloligella sp. GL2]QKP77152.1 amidohydrolase family protein [Methyloligella sp. GL2]